MKKIYSLIPALLLLIAVCRSQTTNIFPSTGAAGIGTVSPNASALLEIKSTAKGFLPPRMTITQRNAIAAPAKGLLIFQTDSMPGLYYYGGSIWLAVASKTAWSLTGNAGTDTSLNFLGTTDKHPLLFRVNNKRAAYLDWDATKANTGFGYNTLAVNTGIKNTAIGYSAMVSNTTGYQNTATGDSALYANNTGFNNSAFGSFSLYANTSGTGNTAVGYSTMIHNKTGNSNTATGNGSLYYNTGDNNTATGYASLFSNISGINNAAHGMYALYSNTTGQQNTASGYAALYSNNDGSYNSAHGTGALNNNTGGSYNTAGGAYALYLNTSGVANTANGYNALYNNSTGSTNTANGSYALSGNTEGNYNTATGSYALWANTTGSTNTADGYKALFSNTKGYNNTAAGVEALNNNTEGVANTATGYQALWSNKKSNYNTAMGYQTMYSNISGYYNTAVGANSLYNNGGYSNTAMGYNTLYKNFTGQGNTATGENALYNNQIGYYNTANGSGALYSNTSGHNNTASGLNALYNNTGGYNTAYGADALFKNTTGTYLTAVGNGADVANGSLNLTNSTMIGYNAVLEQSNKVLLGNFYVTSIGGQVGWTTFSDGRYKKNIKENVKGLLFINSLSPITYTVDINGLNARYDQYRKHDSAYEKMKTGRQPSVDEAAKIVYNGFIAQDVEKAADAIGYNFSGVDKPQTKDGLYGLRYADFVVPLVKAVQELSKMNDSKDAKIDSLQRQNDQQQKQIDAQQTALNDLKILVLSIQQTQQQCSPSANAAVNNNSVIITDGAALEQNTPNPFTHSTSIGYNLQQKYTQAQIIITDKSGKTLVAKNVSGTGKGKLNVDASVLSSGAYNYSLYVDGKLIETKQMILTK